MCKKIPKDLQKNIFSYIYFTTETAEIIKNIISVYQEDHCWSYTKQAKFYYIKNILPFNYYVFNSKNEPEEYLYGPKYYDSKIPFKVEDDEI